MVLPRVPMGEGSSSQERLAKRTPHPSWRVATPSCPLPQGERARTAPVALAAYHRWIAAHTIYLTMSNSPQPMLCRPADQFARGHRVSHPPLSRGQAFFPDEGERSAETARGACEAPPGVPWRLARRDACEAPRHALAIGMPRRSRRSTVVIFGPPGPRFRFRHYPPKRVQRCSSRPGPSVRRAVPVPPGTAGLRATAAEHHSPLRLQNVPRRRPS